MTSKVSVLISECGECTNLSAEDFAKIKNALERYPKTFSVSLVKPLCDKAARKELRNLRIEGCDRAVIALWCPSERLKLSTSRLLPKSINRDLVEIVDLSLVSAKTEEEGKRIDGIVRALFTAISMLSLSEPLSDRKLKFANETVAVLGSDDRAVTAARLLASMGIGTKLLLSQSIKSDRTVENLEIVDTAVPMALAGYPGNFKISFLKGGERVETYAATVLLVSERCSTAVKAPDEFRFVPLESFANEGAGAKSSKGIVFLDDLSSISPGADPVVPSWHRLLEAAKDAAANDLAPSVTMIARDIKSTGLLELLWKEAAEAGVKFVRYDDKSRPRLSGKDNSVIVKDLVLGENLQLPADVIVAPTISRPWEPIFVERLFLPADWDFRARSRGPQRGVAQSPCDGIFLLGYVEYPSKSEDAELSSAVIEISSFLRKGFHTMRGAVALVEDGKCSACATCVRTCPYRAPKMNDSWKAEIVPEKCLGCGSCVAVCPSRAIQLKNCTDEQLKAQMSASLQEVMM